MIPLIVFILLVTLLITNFNRGFTLIFVLSTWISCITLFGQSLMIYISAIITILFFLKYKINSLMEIKSFPLITSFILLILSILSTNIMASVKHTPYMISYILTNVIMVYIAWYQLKVHPTKTIHRFIKYSFIYALILGSYSIFETITQSNPIVEYFNSIHAYSYERIITEIRFGFKRSQSIFPMHTTNGVVSIFLFVLLFYAYRYNMVKNRKLALIPLFLLVASIFLTGARSIILGFIVTLFSFIEIKKISLRHVLGLIICFIVLAISFSEYINEIYQSILDTERVNGSNADMRTYQFEIALFLLLKSPLFGNGISYTWESAIIKYDGLYGAESLWIPIMIEQGVIGILAFSLFFLSLTLFCIKSKCREFSFVVLGFFLANTLSSLPNFSITYILILIIIMVMIKYNLNTRNLTKETLLKQFHSI